MKIFTYENRMETIYPFDDRVIETLPKVISKELKDDLSTICTVNGNRVEFECYIYYWSIRKPAQRYFHSSMDKGTIIILKNAKDKIVFQYEIKFLKNFFFLMGFTLLFSYLFGFNLLFAFFLSASMQVVFLVSAVQKLKTILEYSLKNRYLNY